jgi:hypothetical protein
MHVSAHRASEPPQFRPCRFAGAAVYRRAGGRFQRQAELTLENERADDAAVLLVRPLARVFSAERRSSPLDRRPIRIEAGA